nr:response regulator [Lachnospiraceae bacterium]
KGLGVPLYRAGTGSELERIITKYKLTHLFVGMDEYKDAQEFYNVLSKELTVVVIGTDDVRRDSKSRLRFVPKPFIGYPIVSILNEIENKGSEDEAYNTKYLYCPGVRVLVVDDEQMNLIVAEGLFGSYGMEVTLASGGLEAIEICKTEDFDIIFMDHMMPEIDGVEAMKQIRANARKRNTDITIVALTANAVSGAREMFLNEGFNEFISKPVEIPEVERALKKVLPASKYEYVDEPGGNIGSDSPKEDITGEDEKDVLKRLQESGINVKEGIGYCINDEKFYLSLLGKFVDETDEKLKKLNSFLDEADMENYRVLVHSMKSNTKTIGASDISHRAKALEDASAKKDIKFVNDNHNTFTEKYKNISLVIKSLLGSGEEEAISTGELTSDEFIAELKIISEALDTFEAEKAENLILDISDKEFNGKSIKTIMSEVLDLVNDFELEKAKQKNDIIIEMAERGEGFEK